MLLHIRVFALYNYQKGLQIKELIDMDQLTEGTESLMKGYVFDRKKMKWVKEGVRPKASNREGSFLELKNGKIRYRKVVNGITYEVVAKDKPSCREKMLKKEMQKFTTDWKKDNPTLEGWVTEWHDKYIKGKEDIAEATKAEYWKHLKNHAIPDLGKKFLKDLREIDLQEYLLKKQKKTPSVARNLKIILNMALDAAKRNKLIEYNPVKGIELKAKRATAPPQATGEVLIFLQKILQKTKDTEWELFFLLAMLFGPRKGEILGLPVSDINFEEKKFHIQQQITKRNALEKIKGDKRTIIKTVKAKSFRTLPLPDALVPFVKAQIARAAEITNHVADFAILEEDKEIGFVPKTDLLFLSAKTGGGWYPDSLNKIFDRLQKEIVAEIKAENHELADKVEHLKIHNLRMLVNSFLAAENTDIVKRMQLLGHRDMATNVNHYTADIPQEGLSDLVSIMMSKIGLNKGENTTEIAQN